MVHFKYAYLFQRIINDFIKYFKTYSVYCTYMLAVQTIIIKSTRKIKIAEQYKNQPIL
jgi:hypothetical protein